MKSIKADFCMNRGHEMIIAREGGIKRSELDELELQMLRSGSVPYLLPVDWLEIDGNCTFRYSLTDVTMLSHRLQREPLSMQNFYVLVLGLVDALIQCEEYMLRFDGCLLQDQFIFIGSSWQDIKLAYLPLAGESAVSRHTDLLSTIVRWTSYVDKIDGSGLKRLLHLMNVSHWPIEELRAALLDLIGAHFQAATATKAVKADRFEAEAEHIEVAIRAAEGSNAKPENNMQAAKQFYTYDQEDVQHEQQAASFHKKIAYNEQLSIDQEREQGKEQPKVEFESGQEKPEAIKAPGKMGMRMALLAALLGSALVWRFVYLNEPTQQKLLLSGAATMLLFGLAIFISKRKSKVFFEPSAEEHGDLNSISLHNHAAGGRFSTEFELHSGELRNNRWPFDRNSVSSSKRVNSIQEAAEPLQAADEAPPVKPSIYEPTVLLAKDERQKAGYTTMSWLKRIWEGKEERVELIQPSLKIGRSGGTASYIEDAEGISRLHIEIERHTDGYCAKDLGSRNGSMLNGEQMIPYKQYKLEYGDQIQLAGKNGPVYELKTG